MHEDPKPLWRRSNTKGSESGQPARFHLIGTLAYIEDFDQLQDGNLGLSCKGGEKFEVKNYKIQPDNLIVADAEVIKEDVSDTLLIHDMLTDDLPTDTGSFTLVSQFVKTTIERETWADYKNRSEQLWQSPEWISYQAAELLPLSPDSRQLFLEMDTDERLEELKHILQEVNVV